MRSRNRQAGYALLLVVFLAALIMISLAVALPPVLHEGMREREEELIFRGEQYQRAIGRFYKKYGRYPNTVDELLRTNDRGFLRKEFPDPMTKHGKWRIVGLGPGGALQGSTQNPLGPGSGPGAQPGGSGGGTVGLSSGNKPPEQPKRETRSREEITRGSSIRSSGGQPAYPIAGVVSQSDKPSIRVYNGNSGYANWEFIYDPTKDPALVPPGATQGPGQQPKTSQPTPRPGSPIPRPQM
jgi:type II secretory pathway pseudopilin PulG